jgi:mevalonate kinase
MPATISTAPGKTILFGEHAVVYGQPAIAIPVNERRAKVKIFPVIGVFSEKIQFIAPQIQLDKEYKELIPSHPFKIAMDEVKKYLNIPQYPSCKIFLSSTIPISSGLGSSAAISVALIKGLFEFIGFQPTKSILSQLAYQIEIEFHGHPSGIDNSVIAFNQPILFQKKKDIELIEPGEEFVIVIADSGIIGNTKIAVAGVRERWLKNRIGYEAYFNKIGELVIQAKKEIELGNHSEVGRLMNSNQEFLQRIGVSHPSLENLIKIAIKNGALGSKLSGGGLGGNIIALTRLEKADYLSQELLKNGAAQTIIMTLKKEIENE